jgi:bacterioferritin (cytochrome b1)
LPFYYILKGPEYYSIASFILFLGICGIFYFNAKKHVETTIKELDTNPENDENIKKHYIIHNLSKSYYLVKEAIDERNGEKKKEKLKKSKELIEEAIKLLNGTPTSNSIREVLDFAKIRIREAINDILNNNIDGEHGAINKLKEALKIINYNIGD